MRRVSAEAIRQRRVLTKATSNDGLSAESAQPDNTSARPKLDAAPHQTGPGTVTDDTMWLNATQSVNEENEETTGMVDCSKQPSNTTPCPTPGSAPHQTDAVYNDDLWYKGVLSSGTEEQGPRA